MIFHDVIQNGDEWWQMRTPNMKEGEFMDIRPFAPFSAYFYMTDLSNRLEEGRMTRFGLQKFAEGALALGSRVGTGLDIFGNASSNGGSDTYTIWVDNID